MTTLKKNRIEIQKKIQQNKQAFRKNKQNINFVNFPSTINDNESLEKTKNVLKYNLDKLNLTRKTTVNAYQCAVDHYKLIIDSLLTKNEFLIKQRGIVLNENYQLKNQIKLIQQQNEELKNKIYQMKLNGSSNSINGLMHNGNIFGFFEEQTSNIINQNQNYEIIRQSKDVKETQLFNQTQNITKSINQYQRYSPSVQEQEQSLLIGQEEQNQFNKTSSQNILSPGAPSQYSSDINQTPNYGINQDFQIQKIQKVKAHYVDISSKFISYNNSNNGKSSKQNSNIQFSDQSNKQVQISMNNLNVDLYLPIKNNKQTLLKQQIDTFKRNLHCRNSKRSQSSQNYILEESDPRKNVNNSDNQASQKQNKSQMQSQIQNQNPQIIYCSSAFPEGIFRSFYLSILQFPFLRQQFYLILKQLIQIQQFILFSLYPKNQFWIDIMIGFLNLCQTQKADERFFIDHVNNHKLLDILFIQALKSKVQFLFKEDIHLQTNQDVQNSINGVRSNNMQRLDLMTLRDSVNSFTQQANHGQYHKFLQFFLALANVFQLSCRINGNVFQFVRLEQALMNQQNVNQNQPIFRIFYQEQKKNLIFQFKLYYEQSNNQSRRGSQQRNIYQNSVNRQFKDIQINQSQQNNSISQNNENKSFNQSQNYQFIQNPNKINKKSNQNHYKYEQKQKSSYLQQNNSPISQTNYYQDQESDLMAEYDQHINMNSENISFQGQTINLENTYNSVRQSGQMINKQINNKSNNKSNNNNGKQLRQRKQDYNILYEDYQVISEEQGDYQNRQLILSSYQTSKTNSKVNSYFPSRNMSKEPSISNLQKQKQLKQKTKNRYQDINSENYILKKVKSVASDQFQKEYQDELSRGYQHIYPKLLR